MKQPVKYMKRLKRLARTQTIRVSATLANSGVGILAVHLFASCIHMALRVFRHIQHLSFEAAYMHDKARPATHHLQPSSCAVSTTDNPGISGGKRQAAKLKEPNRSCPWDKRLPHGSSRPLDILTEPLQTLEKSLPRRRTTIWHHRRCTSATHPLKVAEKHTSDAQTTTDLSSAAAQAFPSLAPDSTLNPTSALIPIRH